MIEIPEDIDSAKRYMTADGTGLVETERTPQLIADRAAASGRTEEQVRADFAAGSSLRRLVTAEEVANVVVFLCSPLAVAVTGDAVGVGGGNRGAAHY